MSAIYAERIQLTFEPAHINFSALKRLLVKPAQVLEGTVDHHSTRRVAADRAKKRLGT